MKNPFEARWGWIILIPEGPITRSRKCSAEMGTKQLRWKWKRTGNDLGDQEMGCFGYGGGAGSA